MLTKERLNFIKLQELDVGRLGVREKGIGSYYKIAATGCWICILGINKWGYCRTRIDGKNVYFHKYMYEKYFGSLPYGYELHHTCGIKTCCNIFHLKPIKIGKHQSVHLKENNPRYKEKRYGSKSDST